MKIAVVGAGIAGLSCAWRMAKEGMDVVLFEAEQYFGGHSNTVDVTLDGVTHGVDTGFLVFNHATYPELVNLFEQLDVPTADSAMTFSVKLPLSTRTLEWAGGNLDQVFAQRRNLFKLSFWRMLRDIMRFNRQASAIALGAVGVGVGVSKLSLGEFLDTHGYSEQFRTWYLLPMAASIWSCPADQMLAFPVTSFIRFCHNHGLLRVANRPQWRTVKGGSRVYVDKLLAGIPKRRLCCPVLSVTRTDSAMSTGAAKPGVKLETAAGFEYFDHVVMACHSDQSLALLADIRPDEHAVLAAIAYQPNRAVLHTDTALLPTRRKAWSAWNYQGRAVSAASATSSKHDVCVHYLINQLQPLPFKQAVIVSLNPIDEPDPACVLAVFDYAHPVFDGAAVAAQERLQQFQGQQNTWFAGAWTGYGFHEDGLKSGLAVAESLIQIRATALAKALKQTPTITAATILTESLSISHAG